MKTNYVGHDRVYQKRRAQGKSGWDASDAPYEESKQRLSQLLAEGHAPKTGRFLELGCGAGNMTVWFAAKGYETYGIDISPAAIEWARDRARNLGVVADFRVGSVVDLQSYPDRFFDFVLDGHCLHCIIGADRAKTLAATRRVMRPGGVLSIHTMCAPVKPDRFANRYDPASKCGIIQGIAVRYYGAPDEIVAEITEAGLEVLRCDVKPAGPDDPCGDLTVQARKPEGEHRGWPVGQCSPSGVRCPDNRP